jgi:lipopolysaccharide transport system ATP-binding protein
MSEAIITVEHLGKKYRIKHQARQGYTALRDVIAEKVVGLFKGGTPNARGQTDTATEDFWALKDVSFEVKRGDVVGIIGRNGAGKSTLLKILSRITEPTEGRVRLRGRVASLLEVGTGFHPELTGRENIFLNGAVLGMHRAEITRKFDEIVAFAETEKFLDTPVKRYSSGMYVRLAFAVAAHLEPEILIVDEVLAVGDAQFQKKCLGKMEQVAHDGRTVLFVSHNTAAVQMLCGSAIWLQKGEIIAHGPNPDLLQRYLLSTCKVVNRLLAGPIAIGHSLKLLRFTFNPNPAVSGSPLGFMLELHAISSVRLNDLAILFYSANSTRVAIVDFRASELPTNMVAGHHWVAQGKINHLPFVEGDYRAGLHINTGDLVSDLLDLAEITVAGRETNGHVPYPATARGLVELEFQTCSHTL